MFGKACETKHYWAEAEALFKSFAVRHDFSYDAQRDSVEEFVSVDWTFPAQEGLVHPITLALSDPDELHFGVGEFWSYFFPFPDAAKRFEYTVDAWVGGRARIVQRFGWIIGWLELQILENGIWRKAYFCGEWFQKRDRRVLMNARE